MKRKCSTYKLFTRIGHNANKGLQKEKMIEKVTGISKIAFPMRKRKLIS